MPFRTPESEQRGRDATVEGRSSPVTPQRRPAGLGNLKRGKSAAKGEIEGLLLIAVFKPRVAAREARGHVSERHHTGEGSGLGAL